MSLDDLYREVIMDHYRSPRNKGELPQATLKCDLKNPLCGDEITVQLQVEHGRIADAKFIGQGCSISQASASLMTAAIKGKSVDEAAEIMSRFRHMMEGALDPATADLGDLEALSGVVKFPVRVKCAVLPWEALRKAVSTEKDDEEA